MDETKLAKINTIRRQQGKKLLKYAEATTLIAQRRQADNYHRDETLDFLIGYTIGFPMPSTGGIVGAMLHTSYSEIINNPIPSSISEDHGGSYGGAGASSSFDSSSSSSSDSSSSSSSDSSSSSSSSSSE